VGTNYIDFIDSKNAFKLHFSSTLCRALDATLSGPKIDGPVHRSAFAQ